ncbi:MAG: hypothetical protein HQ564_02830 [Candidatus Saganbacteria bacterium]|nr:hypothetical protein [Candidatus Saganbacteria bacterium]
MGINISQNIAHNKPRLAAMLNKFDKEGDRDGIIEIPDIQGTKGQEKRLQNKYKELLSLIGAKYNPTDKIKGHDVVAKLVTYLKKNNIKGSLYEDFSGKRIGSSGDSMFDGVYVSTSFPGGRSPHFTVEGEMIIPPKPLEDKKYCESLRSCLALQLGHNPSDISIKTFVKNPFPINLPAYIRGQRSSSKYFGEFYKSRTTKTERTKPNSLWCDSSIPTATLGDVLTPSGNKRNTIGMTFLNKLVPKGKTALDILYSHLKGEKGGALIMSYGPNELLSMFGFILGIPKGENMEPREFKANVMKIVQYFSKLPNRIIWIKPIKVDQLLFPINQQNARFTDNSKITPGEYFTIQPWLATVKSGARIKRTNVLSRNQKKRLEERQRQYCKIIDAVAAGSNQVLPVDMNPKLVQYLDSLEKKPLKIGKFMIKNKTELITDDGLHPTRTFYTLIAGWIGQELDNAGVKIRKIDVNKMADKHPERFRPEVMTDSIRAAIVKFMSVSLAPLKKGDPSKEKNLFSLHRQLSAYGLARTNEDALGMGVELALELRTTNLPFYRGSHMSLSARLGISEEYAISRMNKKIKFGLNASVLDFSVFSSPGTNPWRFTLRWGMFQLLQLKPYYGLGLETRYGINHASNMGEAGLNLKASVTGLFSMDGHRVAINAGIEYEF